MDYAELYCPPDVIDAYEQWGASCGPCALAAILRRPVDSLHSYLAGFDGRHYMNPTHVCDALTAVQARYTRVLPSLSTPPSYGLYVAQWEGPWLKPGVPPRAAYRYTHIVGVALCEEYGLMIYDVNASTHSSLQGAWVPHSWWEKEIVPCITATIKRADGGYYMRWAYEVSLPPTAPSPQAP